MNELCITCLTGVTKQNKTQWPVFVRMQEQLLIDSPSITFFVDLIACLSFETTEVVVVIMDFPLFGTPLL
jgi:hypothetical protein